MQKSFFKKYKSYKNLISYYNNLFTKRKIGYKIKQKDTCDIKFPIFLNKVSPFKLRGIVISKHKKTINSSITVGAYISNNKLMITFPMAYDLVKIN
jgi:hypothetical protein